jgi:hypothetical protein
MDAEVVISRVKSWVKKHVIPTNAIQLPFPRNQLASDVQQSLNKADSAVSQTQLSQAIAIEANTRQQVISDLDIQIQNTNQALASTDQNLSALAAQMQNTPNSGPGGTTDHAELTKLAYIESGHIGFASQVALETETNTRQQATAAIEAAKEDIKNKVPLSASATSEQYPTAKSVWNSLQSAIATVPAGGLQPPVEIVLESELPDSLVAADVGKFWIIQDMDVTAPGRTGKAWVNYKDGVKTNPLTIYTTFDQYYSADGDSILLTPTGQLKVKQAWLDRIIGERIQEHDDDDEAHKDLFAPLLQKGIAGTYTQGTDFDNLQTFLDMHINNKWFDDNITIVCNEPNTTTNIVFKNISIPAHLTGGAILIEAYAQAARVLAFTDCRCLVSLITNMSGNTNTIVADSIQTRGVNTLEFHGTQTYAQVNGGTTIRANTLTAFAAGGTYTFGVSGANAFSPQAGNVRVLSGATLKLNVLSGNATFSVDADGKLEYNTLAAAFVGMIIDGNGDGLETFSRKGHHHREMIPSGILTNIEYASNDDLTTTDWTATGIVRRENGSLGFRSALTNSVNKLISFATPYDPLTDIVELQVSVDRVNWIEHRDASYLHSANVEALRGIGATSSGIGFCNNNTVLFGRYVSGTVGWNTINQDWYWRIVKKTFTRTTLAEWESIKRQVWINSQHRWPTDGSEQDFGDGSFGRRFAGTISTPSGSDYGETLFNNSSVKFITGGGWFELGDGASEDLIGNAVSNHIDDNLRNSAIAKGGNGDIRFRSRSDILRTNAPYDVWIRYTKVA